MADPGIGSLVHAAFIPAFLSKYQAALLPDFLSFNKHKVTPSAVQAIEPLASNNHSYIRVQI